MLLELSVLMCPFHRRLVTPGSPGADHDRNVDDF